MDLEFWGVRGTFPSPGKDKVRYGGHTPCASLRTADGGYFVVDAGTGIKDLGARIMAEAAGGGGGKPIAVTLLLTHFHLDHVMGFPFFGPLYSPRASLTIFAPAEPDETKRHLGGLMSGRYFPVELAATPSEKIFRKIDPGLTAGGVRISSCPLVHPQGSVAYRLEVGGASVVWATDTEHPESGIDGRLAAFAAGASYLVYDAMYTPEEYASGKKGWGHSTWPAAVELAAAAGVDALVLSHFSPDHDDRQVDRILKLTKKRFPRTIAARQGMRWELKA